MAVDWRGVNVERLQEVKNHILEEPLRLEMADFIIMKDPNNELSRQFPACGTVACIAGWTTLLEGSRQGQDWRKVWSGVAARATRLLNLTEIQARALFYSVYWEEPFRSQYNAACYGPERDREEVARVTAAYIDHICAAATRDPLAPETTEETDAAEC